MSYSSALYTQLISPGNREHVKRIIAGRLGPRSAAFVDENFDRVLSEFARDAERSHRSSDLMPGITVRDQLHLSNEQFIRYFLALAGGPGEGAELYVVNDGLAASRRGDTSRLSPGGGRTVPSANDVLQSWNRQAGRGVQIREDPQSVNGNPYYHPAAGGRAEVVFCDQSDVGVNQHEQRYVNTQYKAALNQSRDYERDPMGVSTAASDARLLSRRVFRNNEAGVENGIARYEARLYRRNLDRDVSESLRGGERDYQQRGYDMTSLYTCMDYASAAKSGAHRGANLSHCGLQF